MRRSTLTSLLLPTALACALAPALANAEPNAGLLALDTVHLVEAEHNRLSTGRCVRLQGNRIASISAAG